MYSEIVNKLFRVVDGKHNCYLRMFILFYGEITYLLDPKSKLPFCPIMIKNVIGSDGGWAEDIQKWIRPHEGSVYKYEELPLEPFLTFEIPEIRNVVKKIIRSR